MVVSTNRVFDEIKAYVNRKGEPYTGWFVGITADVSNSLFVEHGVSQKQDYWIYKQCPNNRAAKSVKSALMKLGCEGRSGGWDESTNTVFAYLKNSKTTP
jgi:hypothetical protein